MSTQIFYHSIFFRFRSIDNAINSVLPTFNNTGGGQSNAGPTTGTSPSPAPSANEVEVYEFMQCESTDEDCCNGLDNICDLGVDDIMYATLHNAMASFEDGFLFGPNHRYKLESALEAGYRGINLDVCNCGGDIVFCHGVCSLGTRDVNEVRVRSNLKKLRRLPSIPCHSHLSSSLNYH